jgi:large subunit ribosomal protein L9
MKIILKEDVEKLGKFGEIVNVSNGYARNYLIPKNQAWPYEKKYLKVIDSLRSKIETQKGKEKDEALEKAKKIEETSVTIQVEVGQDEKLFGSVTNIDIAEKLKESGIDVDKKNIQIEEPIKKLGVFKVGVKLHSEVEASCKVWIVKEGE